MTSLGFSALSLSLSLCLSLSLSISLCLSLSIERTGDSCPLGQAPMGRNRQDFWGEPARLSIGDQQDPSQAAPHSPITRDQAEYQCLLSKTPTTDRLLVAACRQGHPCRSCAHEDLWSQGSRHGSTPPACVVGACLRSRTFVFCTGRGRRLVF